ncbi:MAG: Na+/H+ antiporter subunit E [Lachnospiraceae bacterium]|nr:Na+/H+ antiporter subunit E [Lachnospiraceae bacterium]MBR5944435.1 Na+/H+ antiporter subunit E [Lachnospiraceae bacterium]
MLVLLLLLWIIYNGQITVEILLFGVAFAGLIFAFMCKFMGYSLKKDCIYMSMLPLILEYVAVLFIEIVKANIAVVPYMLFKNKKQEPVLIFYQTKLKTKTARVILANSITLTPGTITVSQEEDQYIIHCLNASMFEGSEDGIFVRLLTKMEDKALKAAGIVIPEKEEIKEAPYHEQSN